MRSSACAHPQTSHATQLKKMTFSYMNICICICIYTQPTSIPTTHTHTSNSRTRERHPKYSPDHHRSHTHMLNTTQANTHERHPNHSPNYHISHTSHTRLEFVLRVRAHTRHPIIHPTTTRHTHHIPHTRTRPCSRTWEAP